MSNVSWAQRITYEASVRGRKPARVLGVMGSVRPTGRVDRDGARGGDGGVGGGVVVVTLGEEVHVGCLCGEAAHSRDDRSL